MSERCNELFIVDILVASFKIRYAVGDVQNSDDFLADFIVFDVVLRELQVIGEATNNLMRSGILDDTFRIIVDFRNRITHEYFGVDHDIVWQVVKHDVPMLVDTVEALICATPSKSNSFMMESLECAINDHKRAGQMVVVDFLVHYQKDRMSLD